MTNSDNNNNNSNYNNNLIIMKLHSPKIILSNRPHLIIKKFNKNKVMLNNMNNNNNNMNNKNNSNLAIM